MSPYLEGTRTQALTARLPRISADDRGSSMRVFLAQLHQEMTDKMVQSKFMGNDKKKYGAVWRNGPVCTIMN
jgi:hypothetical protein